jgi:hypothetical protein
MRKIVLASVAALPAAMAMPAFAGDILNPSAFASSGVLNLTVGSYTIDTSGGPGGAPVLKDASNAILATGSLYNQGGTFDSTIGVLDFSGVTIGAAATVTVVGANPLALLSRSTEVIAGTVTANGGNGGGGFASPGAGGVGGAGGGSGGTGGLFGSSYVGAPGQGPGGGPSTYWGLDPNANGSGGGYGGQGASGSIFSATYGGLETALLAGSGGSGSGSNFFGPTGGGGGGGGGAIEFGAATSLTFASTTLIQANGGSGGGNSGWPLTGGGGSGGGLIFDAPAIALAGIGSGSLQAGGAYYGGGGGRILFATDSGGLSDGGTIITDLAGLGSIPNVGGLTPWGAGNGTVDIATLSATPSVPEPSTWAMMLLGFGGLGAATRWRRRRSVASA